MAVKKIPFIIILVSLVVGCSDRQLPVSIIFDHEDYDNLSYEELGLLLSSRMLRRYMFNDIKADPKLNQILPVDAEKFDDLNDQVESLLTYSLIEHNSHKLYQLYFSIDGLDAQLSLIKIAKKQIDYLNTVKGYELNP
jgi:hypothetical protein